MHKVHGTKICWCLNGLLGDEAPPSRYDYEILLDYDPSGTICSNLLESFQNIRLMINPSISTANTC